MSGPWAPGSFRARHDRPHLHADDQEVMKAKGRNVSQG